MKEYGIMEILLLTKKQMRAEDGKQEIYLEWPKQKMACYLHLVNCHRLVHHPYL